MIKIFILTLFLTFIIIRLSAYLLHDHKNYKTQNDNSKTFTAFLRKKTNLDIHHFHLGIIIILIIISFTFKFKLNPVTIIVLAIGTSLFIDQLFAWIKKRIYKKSNYFSLNDLIVSFTLHVVISFITIFLYAF
jgi:hypothetical protein